MLEFSRLTGLLIIAKDFIVSKMSSLEFNVLIVIIGHSKFIALGLKLSLRCGDGSDFI